MSRSAGRDFRRGSAIKAPPARRKHLGFCVFQSFHLVDALTAYDNVALAQRLRRQPIQRASGSWRSSNGWASRRRPANSPATSAAAKSSGSPSPAACRLAPNVLLADEPTSQLDSYSAEAVSELFRQAVRQYNPAVIVATHDPRLGSIADRQIHLEDGYFHE